tara:strand:- start:2209 stop:2742 length:534 start_codon:yes stop_codon:yes gene_type:complete
MYCFYGKINDMRSLIWAITLTVLITSPSTADNTKKHDGLVVKDVWSRATPAKNGVAYMTIFNHGYEMDRLVAVESAVSKKAELHTHSMMDGVMRMRRIFSVEVHPGEPSIFAPGGNHVMLFGLKKKLVVGKTFPLTLVFEKAGKLSVTVVVGEAGSRGHGGHKKMNQHFRHKHNHGS